MYPEDMLQNQETRRSLKDKILTQYGRDILKEVRRFEWNRLLLVKKKTDLTFLNRCKDSTIVSTLVTDNHSLRSQHNNQIFIKANIYVDDTFIIWPHGRETLETFKQHLNSLSPSIKFTMEVEINKSLPFLDILITRNDDGSISH